MAVTTSLELMQRCYPKIEVSVVFTILIIVFLVHLSRTLCHL